MNGCCIYKRPYDAPRGWTCPVCGETEQESPPMTAERAGHLREVIRAIATSGYGFDLLDQDDSEATPPSEPCSATPRR